MPPNTTTTVDLLSQVSDAVKDSSELVRKRLVDALVDRELTSRVDLLDKALTKLKDAKKEVDKLRPDVETFDETGAKVTSHYSKAKLEERKKAVEAKEKLEKAVEQALSGESFDKLKELMK